VGGSEGPQKRNGTVEYYMSDLIITNDLKGVGAFILAGIEIKPLDLDFEPLRIAQLVWSANSLLQ
jgi:unsaturated rhamnogalacturonyl hydrolase